MNIDLDKIKSLLEVEQLLRGHPFLNPIHGYVMLQLKEILEKAEEEIKKEAEAKAKDLAQAKPKEEEEDRPQVNVPKQSPPYEPPYRGRVDLDSPPRPSYKP